jgi:hypothetical protein
LLIINQYPGPLEGYIHLEIIPASDCSLVIYIHEERVYEDHIILRVSLSVTEIYFSSPTKSYAHQTFHPIEPISPIHTP